MEKFFDTNVEADYLDEYLFTRCMDINYSGLWNNHHSTFDTINWKQFNITDVFEISLGSPINNAFAFSLTLASCSLGYKLVSLANFSNPVCLLILS